MYKLDGLLDRLHPSFKSKTQLVREYLSCMRGNFAIEVKARSTVISVADPDPGSGAFLTPGYGIRNRFFPDPASPNLGSRIPNPYF